jgi:hypothetical protein
MKKIRFSLPVCPLAAVILELLPYGVVLRFGQPDGEPIRQTFSYFSLIPYGYAAFSPLITAVMSMAAIRAMTISTVRMILRRRSFLFLLKASNNSSECWFCSLMADAPFAVLDVIRLS